MEQNNVDDRITLALNTLRNELLDLRSQDVKLMKQLLNINDTIQTLFKLQGHTRQPRTFSGHQRRCMSSYMLPNSTNQIEQKTFTRRLSAPMFENTMGSSSSLEGSVCSEDMSEYSESEEDLSTRSPKLSRPPSLSFIRDSDSDICDEDILRTNIRVWKLSKSDICC
ncbi:uncharacterized protein LOC134687528 isoform X2 [Mytilus trossulus]|uniref:uncharacterized protein LOC134687528 isoform X2 n=1 Tax=Mytilus trossulus TaxID=6551 RepID=UPI0030051DF1